MIRAKGARRHLLRLFDVTRGFKQTVQSAGRRTAFGEKKVGTVEFAHVANPIGLEDRFSARDRQRMEGPDRPLCVLLQIVEERRVVAILDALENRQVQLQQLFYGVKDPAHSYRLRTAGDPFNPSVRDEIEIELRAYSLQHLCQAQRQVLRALVLVCRLDQSSQDR